MKVAIIIQARMGSTRLPGKSMMKIRGQPIIQHVIERAKLSKEADDIVVATTRNEEDDRIAKIAERLNVKVYRGNAENVLDRYYQAAKSVKAGIVIRITGDCPLIDPFLIDKLIILFKKGDYDYASNTQEPWMDGFDTEVFSFKALEDAWKNADMASQREHVTLYIKDNKKFKRYFMENPIFLADVHCSVDRIKDLKFVREIYGILLKNKKNTAFTYKDVIDLLKANSQIKKINSESIVNEGYFKSIKEDKKIKIDTKTIPSQTP